MEIITLGIGPGSSIPTFLTFGLGDFGDVDNAEPDGTIVMAADVTRIVMQPDEAEVVLS